MSACQNCGGSGRTERLTSLRGRSHTSVVVCSACLGSGIARTHEPIEHGPIEEVSRG
ncbi:hypothetical protein SEA_NICOLE72_89 [Microbacterium phage Nicole72]|uniref:Uncharacterized protein n=1 Tax=Microbacterium phage Nicole72 TaxID=3062838 RepID=A0ACD4UHM3_9CAUD|nr:hypothetical protein SEA_NICOLE72_89 [Microbacterium phage Nicole72]